MRIALLLWLVLLSPFDGRQQPKPPDSEQKRAEQTKPQTPVTVSDNQKEPDKQENGTTTNVENEMPWWKDAGEATWALVIIGILGTLAAIFTLVTIARQTKALMDADHALILTLWEGYIHINPDKPGVLSHCFNWHLHNAGKSPTFIRQVSSRFIRDKRLERTSQEAGLPPPENNSYAGASAPRKKSPRIYANRKHSHL